MQTKVTITMLREMGTFREGINAFKRVFPDGAEITLKNCLKAAKHNLCIYGFAHHYFPSPYLEAYKKAIEPYEEVFETAIEPHLHWEVYIKALALTFWEIYQQYERKLNGR